MKTPAKRRTGKVTASNVPTEHIWCTGDSACRNWKRTVLLYCKSRRSLAGSAQRATRPANSYTTDIGIGQSVNIIPPAKRRGRWPATGDRRPATGDRRSAIGDRRPATGDRQPAHFRWLKKTNLSHAQSARINRFYCYVSLHRGSTDAEDILTS